MSFPLFIENEWKQFLDEQFAKTDVRLWSKLYERFQKRIYGDKYEILLNSVDDSALSLYLRVITREKMNHKIFTLSGIYIDKKGGEPERAIVKQDSVQKILPMLKSLYEEVEEETAETQASEQD